MEEFENIVDNRSWESYEVTFRINLIEPQYDRISMEWGEYPTHEQAKQEIILLKPYYESKKDLLFIENITKFKKIKGNRRQ